MAKKFYLDTCIWIDLYEDRRGYTDETLATPVFQLFSLIIKRGDRIIISNVILKELEKYTPYHKPETLL